MDPVGGGHTIESLDLNEVHVISLTHFAEIRWKASSEAFNQFP